MPANQSARQKGLEFDDEDFATCQPYPYLHLLPHGSKPKQTTNYHATNV
jgi:hypothetical protein